LKPVYGPSEGVYACRSQDSLTNMTSFLRNSAGSFDLHPNYFNQRSDDKNVQTLSTFIDAFCAAATLVPDKEGWIHYSCPDERCTADNIALLDYRYCTNKLQRYVTQTISHTNVRFWYVKDYNPETQAFRYEQHEKPFSQKVFSFKVNTSAKFPVQIGNRDIDLAKPISLTSLLVGAGFTAPEKELTLRLDLSVHTLPKNTSLTDFLIFLRSNFTPEGEGDDYYDCGSTERMSYFNQAYSRFEIRIGATKARALLHEMVSAENISISESAPKVSFGKDFFAAIVEDMSTNHLWVTPTRDESTKRGRFTPHDLFKNMKEALATKGVQICSALPRNNYSVIIGLDPTDLMQLDGDPFTFISKTLMQQHQLLPYHAHICS
jgi:hypothetical protein